MIKPLTADEFLQAHAEWKYGKTAVATEDEEPHTWLMSKSGHYFPFKNDKDYDSDLATGMFCIFLNTTSLVMRVEQETVLNSRK